MMMIFYSEFSEKQYNIRVRENVVRKFLVGAHCL